MLISTAISRIRLMDTALRDPNLVSDARIEIYLQALISELARLAHWPTVTSTARLTAGVPVVDIAALVAAGFTPERWIDARLKEGVPAVVGHTTFSGSTLIDVSMTYGGQAYDGTEAVTVSGNATVTIGTLDGSGAIDTLTVTNGGSGYITPPLPTITIAPPKAGSTNPHPLLRTDYDDVRRHRLCHAETREPTRIAITSNYSTLMGLSPIPDEAYYLDVKWWAPADTAWTPGSAPAGQVIGANAGASLGGAIALPENAAAAIVTHVASSIKNNIPEMLALNGKEGQELQRQFKSLMGLGSTGVVVIPRSRAW